MATDAAGRFIRQLRQTASEEMEPTDGQLLALYVEHQDGAAFEALVRRHGPMVWGVCRRLLRDHHAAEEAFQATFLVLVRKAGSVLPRDKVANWLYGVARMTAVRARTANARRREAPGPAPEPETPPIPDASDLWPVLDEELGCLPSKYRAPVILCDLEGRTYKQAASQLGWPEGTVASRLVRARAMLADRLTRRGVTLSVGSLVLVMSQEAMASVSTPLVAGEVACGSVPLGVAELTERVVTAMFWTKLKPAAALLGGVLVCGTLLAYHAPAKPAISAPLTVRTAPAVQERSDREKLQGTWDTVSSVRDGLPSADAPAELRPNVVIKGDKYTIAASVGFVRLPASEMSFKMDQSKNPREIDLVPAAGPNKGKTIPAIYVLEDDDLKICFGPAGGKRPSEFVSRANSDTILVNLKRIDP